MMLSRRSLIGAGVVLAAAGLAGCSRAVRTALTTTSAPPDHPTPTATASPTAAPVSLAPPAPSSSRSVPPSTTAGSAAAVSAQETPSGPAAEIANGPRDKPSVALTFHGAGDLEGGVSGIAARLMLTDADIDRARSILADSNIK